MHLHLLPLLTPLLLALPTTSLTILLPLYLYPGPNATAWSSVTDTISAHPTVQFTIVINPNSGPGTPSYPTDANIISGIAALNSYANVRTVGYVETYHASRDIAAVNAEVDVYAKWATYTAANIAIGGIYFDDVSSEPTDSIYTYYSTISQHARTAIPSPTTKIVFNPGYRAPTPLFAYADTIVEYEDSYANYLTQGIIAQIPESVREKSAVQVYDTPPGADVKGLIGEMAQSGIGGVYFGEDCCYKVWGRGLLEEMAGAV